MLAEGRAEREREVAYCHVTVIEELIACSSVPMLH
jgi:hypothetical protein